VARLKPRGFVRRIRWGVADQAVSSITNLALVVIMARLLDPEGFGAFSLAYATYAVGLNVSRAVSTEPLIVRYSGATESRWRSATRSATGSVLLVGCAALFGCIGVGLAIGGPVGASFVGLGLAFPGLLLQDSWRFAFFAAGRGASAFANDLAWGTILFVVLVIWRPAPGTNLVWPVLAWGGAGTVAGILGAWQARVRPEPARAIAWWREHKDLAPRYLIEFVSLAASAQLSLLAVTGAAGLAGVAALRISDVIVGGPLRVLFSGIQLVTVPEAVRLSQERHRLRELCIVVAAGLALSAVVWGWIVMAVPDGVAVFVFGANWELGVPVLLPRTALLVASGVVTGALVGLRGTAASRRSLRARLVVSILVVPAAFVGALLGGAPGAAWTMALVVWCGALVWWREFVRASNQPSSRPTSVTAIALEAYPSGPET
jgi:O-antigen/teichoic acid export membrane protein